MAREAMRERQCFEWTRAPSDIIDSEALAAAYPGGIDLPLGS